MSVLPLNWPDKVDSPELLAWLQQFGLEKYIDSNQINSIRDALNELYFSSNPDRIISLGTETIEGNEHTYEDYTWQLGGVQVNNIGNPSIIVIPSSTVGFKRKDISVFTPTGTIERVAGIETDGEVVTSPDVPEGTLYYKSYDIDGDTIEVDPEPPAIDGSIYKKKIENTRWKSTQSGANVVIPFQAAGQSHYSVVHSGLISVAGFSTAALTTPMYEGQDVLFENQTGNPITLKDSFAGVNTPFDLGADLVVPNEGKIWFRSRNGLLEMIMKSWSDVKEVIEGYFNSTNFYTDAGFTSLITPESGKIYVALDTNLQYRWSGSAYVRIGGGANKQIFQWWGGTWTTTNLNQYYYISYNSRAIETLPGGTGTTITASMTGRNQGLFIAPFNCKIRRVMFMDSGSGAYSGYFVIASGIPNYGGTWNITHYNIVTHLNTAISSPGYNKNKFEYLVSDNITVPKGYAICPMLIFSSQAQAGKLLEISIEIEEVV